MTRRLMLALLAVLLLAACSAPPPAQELAGAGGPSPRAIVESFLEDLNRALAAPNLAEPEARQVWAERLAGHFAPGERADQRAALAVMLDGFAASIANPISGSKASLQITYSGTELIEQQGGRALVRVVDGVLTLRFFDAQGELLRERTGGLTAVLGQANGGLPTLQVAGSWFMTEG